ncbi:hypothetical protein C8Q76DRAFT_833383 [Earliella scabrosa]|nr:hypothetical protein C8Q76DRAFT_833383 [Earliella scabrosa]
MPRLYSSERKLDRSVCFKRQRLPSKKYATLVEALPRRHANLLLQLRTGHAPLYKHLAWLGKVPSATCPACGEAPESTAHFLLSCDAYALHRAVHFSSLGRSGRSLSVLLNSKDALSPLFQYINATGRFRGAFGAFADLKLGELDDR